jgi:hypothetical protein
MLPWALCLKFRWAHAINKASPQWCHWAQASARGPPDDVVAPTPPMNFPDDTVEPKPQLLAPNDAVELKPSTKPRALMRIFVYPSFRRSHLPDGTFSLQRTGYYLHDWLPLFFDSACPSTNGISAPRIWRLSAFLHIVDTIILSIMLMPLALPRLGAGKMTSFNGGKW